MKKIICNYVGSRETMKTGLEVAEIKQRYQQQPPFPGTADIPDVLAAAHVPATLNEQSALAPQGTPPLHQYTPFAVSPSFTGALHQTGGFNYSVIVCNDPQVPFLSSLLDACSI